MLLMLLVMYLCICLSSFQTLSITLWISSYCDSVLRPFKSNLQKKKKKKKETSIVMVGDSAETSFKSCGASRTLVGRIFKNNFKNPNPIITFKGLKLL